MVFMQMMYKPESCTVRLMDWFVLDGQNSTNPTEDYTASFAKCLTNQFGVNIGQTVCSNIVRGLFAQEVSVKCILYFTYAHQMFMKITNIYLT